MVLITQSLIKKDAATLLRQRTRIPLDSFPCQFVCAFWLGLSAAAAAPPLLLLRYLASTFYHSSQAIEGNQSWD